MTKSKFRGAHDYIGLHNDPEELTSEEISERMLRDYRHKYPHISKVWDMPDDEREPYLKMLVTSANLVRLTIIAAGLSVGFAIIAVAAALWRGMS